MKFQVNQIRLATFVGILQNDFIEPMDFTNEELACFLLLAVKSLESIYDFKVIVIPNDPSNTCIVETTK